MFGISLSRFSVAALAFTSAAGGLAAAYPGGLSAAVRDLCDYRANAAALDETRTRSNALGTRSAALTDRITDKIAVAQEVASGRMTLSNATDRFTALNGGDQTITDFLNRKYDGSTAEEKTARNVIDFVLAMAETETAAAPRDLVARLDDQFRATFGHPR